MTEAEWLASEGSAAMLRHLTERRVSSYPVHAPRDVPLISGRKLRLFACACCRLLWGFLGERDRRAVVLTERWAEGEDVHSELYDLISGSEGMVRVLHWADAVAVAGAIIDGARRRNEAILPAYAALLREIVGNPFKPAYVVHPVGGELAFDADTSRRTGKRCVSIGMVGKTILVRRDWLTPTVLTLARAAYEERGRKVKRDCEACNARGWHWTAKAAEPAWKEECDYCEGGIITGTIDDGSLDPARLLVLSDALEEAGVPPEDVCPDCKGRGSIGPSPGSWAGAQGWIACSRCDGIGRIPHPLLTHLRSPGVHVRGCWATDCILGRS